MNEGPTEVSVSASSSLLLGASRIRPEDGPLFVLAVLLVLMLVAVERGIRRWRVRRWKKAPERGRTSEASCNKSDSHDTECAAPVVWQGCDRDGLPVSVTVHQPAGLIQFQNCVVRRWFLMGWLQPDFYCTLSDLRCFHQCLMKHETAVALKTDVGRVTVRFVSGDLQALMQLLSDVVPGGHRRFHEDHPAAILLMILVGLGVFLLSAVCIPDRNMPKSPMGMLIALGLIVMATRQLIAAWTGRRNSIP